MKKLTAMLCTVAMVFGLATSAMAASISYEPENVTVDSQYEASIPDGYVFATVANKEEIAEIIPEGSKAKEVFDIVSADTIDKASYLEAAGVEDPTANVELSDGTVLDIAYEDLDPVGYFYSTAIAENSSETASLTGEVVFSAKFEYLADLTDDARDNVYASITDAEGNTTWVKLEVEEDGTVKDLKIPGDCMVVINVLAE